MGVGKNVCQGPIVQLSLRKSDFLSPCFLLSLGDIGAVRSPRLEVRILGSGGWVLLLTGYETSGKSLALSDVHSLSEK